MQYVFRKSVLRAVALAVAICSPTLAGAAVICVSPTDGSCETSVQAAIDAAVAGDTVRLDPGRYDENVVIPVDKAGLTLLGNGGVLDANFPNSGVGLSISAPNVTLNGVTIQNGEVDLVRAHATATDLLVSGSVLRGSDQDCLDIEGSGATVVDSEIAGCDTDAINVTADGFTARDNRLSYFDDNGIDTSDGSDVTVVDNVFFQADGDGIEISDAANATVSGNKASDLDGDFIRLSNVTNFTVTKNKVSGSYNEAVSISCGGTACIGTVSGNSGRQLQNNGVVNVSFSNAIGSDIRIEKNKGKQNESGILVSGDGGSVTFSGNKVADTFGNEACFVVDGPLDVVFERNGGKGCGADGFEILGAAVGLTGNKISKALGNGIELLDGNSGTIVRNNKISGSIGVGISVHSGNTGVSVTGNKASKNREDFCDAGTGTITSGNIFATTYDPMAGDCPAGD